MKFAIFLLLLFVGQNLAAQEASTQGKNNFNLTKDGIALSGYDPVSYFSESGPKKGDTKFKYQFNGATYIFSTSENRATYMATPTKYQPAYGGWCAYAIGSSGKKVEVDPLTYKIFNGKLLLFYNKSNVNTLKLWNQNESAFNSTAEKNWRNINNK